MKRYLELIEKALDDVLPAQGTRPAVLSEAMRYALDGGGKRIRPVVCLAAAEAVGGEAGDALYPAAAIELLHNYTLIHDDLPAMDNDVERRGRPTVWKQFGEANAILAGDALQALAFQVAARSPRQADVIAAVLGAAGVGVVCGQVEDIVRETSQGQDATDYIYAHKTADLFVAAAKMGALAGGGTEEQVTQLGRFGFNLGMAFQYEDDLLDGDSPYARAETERLVHASTIAATEALNGLPGPTAFLVSLANHLVERKF